MSFLEAIKWWGWDWIFILPMTACGSLLVGALFHSFVLWAVLFAVSVMFCIAMPMFDL